jgi:ATP-dependent Clp protease ATP-binding subunit ClpX
MFSFDGADLVFEPEALTEIAKLAIERKTGARGLRSICEQVLQDTMFELPDVDDIKQVVVTPAAVRGQVPPQLVRK